MTENQPDELGPEETTDELDQQLLEAMRNLSRKNRKVEEYLDGLARTVEKQPQQPQQKNEPPPA